jgi:CDP-glucose 4,6-dehydratase
MFTNCYRNKKILITGHTGFKGSWLSAWLSVLGGNVVGISRKELPTDPCNFEVSSLGQFIEDHRYDIRDIESLRKIVSEVQPDFVFHLAAQALVRPAYDNPLETITTNAIGSANLLEVLHGIKKPVVAVMITSDKVYDNQEWIWGYRETDRLGGRDPYSASKGMAELAIRSYVESFFDTIESNVRVGITRAGNVIGGGDWAKDRIVPDCVRAWSKGEKVEIRNPEATRPWQHVLEPLSGYLLLGTELFNSRKKHGESYNFGPPAEQNHSVRNLIDEMAKCWDQVRWKDVSQSKNIIHEASLLKLNCDKALNDLSWLPTLHFEETVQMTVEWYRKFYQENDQKQSRFMFKFLISQIDQYTHLAKKRGINWATN